MTIGFIGLGVMGGPMAGHLLTAGQSVIVYNRTASKTDPLKERGAQVAASLKDLAQKADVIITCVTRTEDVEQVLYELTQAAKPNTLFIDHSTILPAGAEKISADLKAKGFRFVDAPITGGSIGAKNGKLTIFLGGDEDAVAEALPIVQAYAANAQKVGGPGKGQLMKMANQIAVGASVLGVCEALNFAVKGGLDAEQARSMIGGGSGGSWAFQNYGPKILVEDWTPGFSIDNQVKDFGYCETTAKEIDAAIPGTKLIESLMQRLQAKGEGGLTTVALYKVLQDLSPQ